MADIVLPATMFMEHDDLYYGGGHQHISVGAKLIDPPGECRSNHEVLQGLGRRLNARASRLRDDAARTDRRDAEEERPRRYRERWRRICGAISSRISAPRIISTASRTPTRSSTSRPTGRIRPSASPVWGPWEQMPSLPDHWTIIEEADEAHPFRLATSPSRSFLNTSFNETPIVDCARRQAVGDDASEKMPAALRIADGDAVTLGNVRGETTLTVKLFDGLRRGVLIARSIPAEQGPYRRPRHQHADRRRGGRAGRRRGVP